MYLCREHAQSIQSFSTLPCPRAPPGFKLRRRQTTSSNFRSLDQKLRTRLFSHAKSPSPPLLVPSFPQSSHILPTLSFPHLLIRHISPHPFIFLRLLFSASSLHAPSKRETIGMVCRLRSSSFYCVRSSVSASRGPWGRVMKRYWFTVVGFGFDFFSFRVFYWGRSKVAEFGARLLDAALFWGLAGKGGRGFFLREGEFRRRRLPTGFVRGNTSVCGSFVGGRGEVVRRWCWGRGGGKGRRVWT